MNEVRIGIIGSRRRISKDDRRYVFELVEFLFIEFGNDLTIISGGCKFGADNYAELAADKYGIVKKIFKPKLYPPPKCRIDATLRYYDRNKKIAESSDYLYALVADDRTGGTENTIKYMNDLKKPYTEVGSDFSETGTAFDGNAAYYGFLLTTIFKKPHFKR